jgi:NAD(P)-dependent dehydrogenase (short-subunit alcohol dehydrogenase family)
MQRLSGKTVIITGAAGGTGRASSKLFAEEGANIAALDINKEWLKTLEEEVTAAGGKITPIVTDLMNEGSIKEAVQRTIDKYGRIDVLFNNVGGAHKADAGFLDITSDVWDFSIKLNVNSALYCCQQVIPHMIEQGGGSIILTGTGGSQFGDFYTSAYAIAKGSVNTMYLYIATQFGRQNIRANLLQPGLSVNERLAQLPAEALKPLADQSPLGRPGYPIDLAHAALFLASDDSKYITGAYLAVDGGVFAHMPTYIDSIRAMERAPDRKRQGETAAFGNN